MGPQVNLPAAPSARTAQRAALEFSTREPARTCRRLGQAVVERWRPRCRAVADGAGRIDVALASARPWPRAANNNRTGVQVTPMTMPDHEPPPSGLSVNGRSPTLDALEWIGSACGGNDDDGMLLRAVDARRRCRSVALEQTRSRCRSRARSTGCGRTDLRRVGRLTVLNAEGAPSAANSTAYPAVAAGTGAAAPVRRRRASMTWIRAVAAVRAGHVDPQFGKVVLGQAVPRTAPAGRTTNGRAALRAPDQEIDTAAAGWAAPVAPAIELTAQVRSEDLGA